MATIHKAGRACERQTLAYWPNVIDFFTAVNLQMFVIRVFVLVRTFQPYLIFVGNARVLKKTLKKIYSFI